MSDSSPESQNKFFAQFLDDYFAECAEHLALLRSNLLAMEKYLGQPQVERSLLDELFRSFHTLKGISGMVGLTEAEQLAHGMESYLRALRQSEKILTESGFEALMSGTIILEQVIGARQKEERLPDIAPIMTQFESLIDTKESPSESKPAESESRSIEIAEALQEGPLWRFEFVPTPALAERGVNVSSIRERLQSIGEVKQATPRVTEGGGIAFEFIVASPAEEASFAEWISDNLTYARIKSVPEKPRPQPASGVESDVPTSQPALMETESSVLPPASVVRVDLARLDDLMRLIGELVISRARLEDNLKEVKRAVAPAEWRSLQETNQAMSKQIRDLREAVMRVRMVQLGEIFERMQFVVRDLGRESNKKIRLESSGKDTVIDKFLVERMMDPLLHLMRNAVTHGLETVEERAAAGKPSEGLITLRAANIGDNVLIEIADDGRGIDVDSVARRARSLDLIEAEGPIEDEELLELICQPGFSTREQADRGSGRGVGMDIVARAIKDLGGRLSLTTERSIGTQFTIELPLTLAISDALIARVGNERFAIPQSAVQEVIEVESSAVKIFENNEIISYRDGVLPLVRLSRLFNLEQNDAPVLHVFVIGKGSNAMGLAVDRIIGQSEIVVRGISDPLIRVDGIAGATELGDARVVLILDVPALRRLVTSSRGPARY